jgi:diguanylate cyclase (GGDEF)-like protein
VDVSHLRKEFSVYVIDPASSQAQSLSETVKSAGYGEVSFFPTFESALAMASQSPPHLVLVDLEKSESTAESFLIDLQGISAEILVILMISSRQVLTALQLVGRNLAYDSVVRPTTSTLEIIQKLDRGADRLYFQFESEQLREFHGVPDVPSSAAPSDSPVIAEFLSKIAKTKELDQTVQYFMEGMSKSLGETPILYFKFVASHLSLLVAQALWLPIDKIRGVGIDLKKENPQLIDGWLSEPSHMEPLKQLVSQVFRREKFTAFSHQGDGETLGLFVILDQVNLDGPIDLLRQVFNLAYDRNLKLKEKHALDTQDQVTGLFNRRHFSVKLDEEISRARRIFMPVSLITIDLDGFKSLNEKVGFRQADAVLRMIATVLKRTTRLSDILARIGPDEIVVLLPHTGHMGAATKAERVRKMIESTRFPLIESLGTGPLTVSCGVSEYPSFCNDAESLLRTADEALAQVKQRGGNKVCLAAPPHGFQMDFAPRDIPPATGSDRRQGEP